MSLRVRLLSVGTGVGTCRLVRVLGSAVVPVLAVRLGSALLLRIDRFDVAQEERKDQDGQEDELVVQNEHCVGKRRGEEGCSSRS